MFSTRYGPVLGAAGAAAGRRCRPLARASAVCAQAGESPRRQAGLREELWEESWGGDLSRTVSVEPWLSGARGVRMPKPPGLLQPRTLSADTHATPARHPLLTHHRSPTHAYTPPVADCPPLTRLLPAGPASSESPISQVRCARVWGGPTPGALTLSGVASTAWGLNRAEEGRGRRAWCPALSPAAPPRD